MEIKHVSKTFQEFCNAISLHGYSYIQDTNSWILKFFWLMTVGIFTAVSIHLISTNVKHYMESNLITTIDTSTASVSVSHIIINSNSKGVKEVLTVTLQDLKPTIVLCWLFS